MPGGEDIQPAENSFSSAVSAGNLAGLNKNRSFVDSIFRLRRSNDSADELKTSGGGAVPRL
ncbi:MAG: hypothetical protein ACD_39C01795G0004 [uncultured bacterium]|nr:MAG: hypothetical protein ACD_39C01795G0004 [uncultured bacterium]